MNEREKLIDTLYEIKDVWDADELTGKSYEEIIADFILADRKRIVEPLISIPPDHYTGHKEYVKNAISQTLKNAGL